MIKLKVHADEKKCLERSGLEKRCIRFEISTPDTINISDLVLSGRYIYVDATLLPDDTKVDDEFTVYFERVKQQDGEKKR